MKFSTLMRFIHLWPPFLGAGVRVLDACPNGTALTVRLKIHFWNRNYVGTQYGGSLYSMTDAFYVLMLYEQLGRGYVVWDKSATIRYRKPARATVYARFELPKEQVAAIREQVEREGRAEPEFHIPIIDTDGVLVAEVTKRLHVSQAPA